MTREAGARARPRHWSLIALLAPGMRRRSCSWPIRACTSSIRAAGSATSPSGTSPPFFRAGRSGLAVQQRFIRWAAARCRRGAGVARRAHRRSIPPDPLSRLDRIARHPIRSLHRRLASVPGQSRSGQRCCSRDVRRAALHQHLFARRHDLRRRPAVVAAGFLLLSPVFRNSDASFEEAASICGAGLLSRRSGTSPSAWRGRRCWRLGCWSSSRRPNPSRCRRWSACRARRAC